MKLKIDNNLPREIAAVLGAAGHDAATAFEQGLASAPDAKLVVVCHREERALLTADLDLSDIRQYPPERSPGYIVLRLKRQSRDRQIALVRGSRASPGGPTRDKHPLDRGTGPSTHPVRAVASRRLASQHP
jgi:predicted nuclease of predicted toxin-antitoxin system